MRIFLKRLLAIIATIAAVVALTGIVLVLMGYRPFVIESGSMEPLYKQGSLCFVNTKTPLSSLVVGDVLAYRTESDVLVLHRLVGVSSSSSDELIAEMQGDANNTVQDVTLNRVNFIGREAFTIPELGLVVSFISSMRIVVLILIALLIILACIPKYPQLHRHAHKGEQEAST